MQEIVTSKTELTEVNRDLFTRYLNFLDVAPKTEQTYTRALRQFFNYLLRNGIKAPVRDDIKAFREELIATGHKPTTVQNYIIAVRLFFTWTAQEGLYPNVAEHVKGAKINRDHKKDYLTPSQIKEVLAGIDRTTQRGKRDYAVLSLMVTCGLRTIEVSRANIEDLSTLGSDTVLYIQGKGRDEKSEYVKVSAPVEKLIRDYLKTRNSKDITAPLFTSLSNNSKEARLTTRSVSDIAKEAMKKAGYDSPRLTAHSLRHSAVTISLMESKDIREVQQFARHKNIATTMIYDHALEMAKNSCSEAITSAIF